jgi:hypothetical protein
MQRLGRRVAPHLQRHRQVLNEWIEPPVARRLANA